MRTSFSLAAYVVRVRNVATRENEQLDAIAGSKDLFGTLFAYLDTTGKAPANDENGKQVLAIPNLQSGNRRIYGIIETGHYGLESNLYDVRKREVVHKRTENEADMLPFFFLFEIPTGTDEAVLILQRIGKYGIRTLLSSLLKETFQAEFP
ncbi:MAG: hypothetical protein WAK91_12560, partial [Candidatus Acidiferrales bacterium]